MRETDRLTQQLRWLRSGQVVAVMFPGGAIGFVPSLLVAPQTHGRVLDTEWLIDRLEREMERCEFRWN